MFGTLKIGLKDLFEDPTVIEKKLLSELAEVADSASSILDKEPKINILVDELNIIIEGFTTTSGFLAQVGDYANRGELFLVLSDIEDYIPTAQVEELIQLKAKLEGILDIGEETIGGDNFEYTADIITQIADRIREINDDNLR